MKNQGTIWPQSDFWTMQQLPIDWFVVAWGLYEIDLNWNCSPTNKNSGHQDYDTKISQSSLSFSTGGRNYPSHCSVCGVQCVPRKIAASLDRWLREEQAATGLMPQRGKGNQQVRHLQRENKRRWSEEDGLQRNRHCWNRFPFQVSLK